LVASWVYLLIAMALGAAIAYGGKILVVIQLPAYLATGFIIYFLLREPLPYGCPNCTATVSARYNFCPECKFVLRPACPQCTREVRRGDRYCLHCAHDLGQTSETA
jgi:hypothetical protein